MEEATTATPAAAAWQRGRRLPSALLPLAALLPLLLLLLQAPAPASAQQCTDAVRCIDFMTDPRYAGRTFCPGQPITPQPTVRANCQDNSVLFAAPFTVPANATPGSLLNFTLRPTPPQPGVALACPSQIRIGGSQQPLVVQCPEYSHYQVGDTIQFIRVIARDDECNYTVGGVVRPSAIFLRGVGLPDDARWQQQPVPLSGGLFLPDVGEWSLVYNVTKQRTFSAATTVAWTECRTSFKVVMPVAFPGRVVCSPIGNLPAQYTTDAGFIGHLTGLDTAPDGRCKVGATTSTRAELRPGKTTHVCAAYNPDARTVRTFAFTNNGLIVPLVAGKYLDDEVADHLEGRIQCGYQNEIPADALVTLAGQANVSLLQASDPWKFVKRPRVLPPDNVIAGSEPPPPEGLHACWRTSQPAPPALKSIPVAGRTDDPIEERLCEYNPYKLSGEGSLLHCMELLGGPAPVVPATMRVGSGNAAAEAPCTLMQLTISKPMSAVNITFTCTNEFGVTKWNREQYRIQARVADLPTGDNPYPLAQNGCKLALVRMSDPILPAKEISLIKMSLGIKGPGLAVPLAMG